MTKMMSLQTQLDFLGFLLLCSHQSNPFDRWMWPFRHNFDFKSTHDHRHGSLRRIKCSSEGESYLRVSHNRPPVWLVTENWNSNQLEYKSRISKWRARIQQKRIASRLVMSWRLSKPHFMLIVSSAAEWVIVSIRMPSGPFRYMWQRCSAQEQKVEKRKIFF